MRTKPLTALALAAAAAAVLCGVPAARLRAAETVVDTALGARIAGDVAAADVDVFRVPLLAGTDLRIRLDANDDAPGKGGSGPLPEAVLLGPSGAELGRVAAEAGELRLTIGGAGTHRVEVRAGSYAGGYELRIEGTAPRPADDTRTVVTVTGAPVPVRVTAPAGSAVEIEVRRRSGAAPVVLGVTDDAGRALDVSVRKASASRVRLADVPVALGNGLDVLVAGADGGAGTYEVRAKVVSHGDRAGGGDERAPRRVVVRLAPGVDPLAVAAAQGFTFEGYEGAYAVFETPEDHDGLEDDDSAALRAVDGVLLASPDDVARLPEGSQANAPVVGSELGRADLHAQAALAAVRAPAAHALADGTGAVVAVLDGGFDVAHEALAGRVLAGRDFVDGDDDPSDEENGIDDDGDTLVDEGFGHGTFVASVVLAAAPGASILPVRVLDSDGRGLSSRIAAGIEWAVDHGASVLNLSFGTLGGNAVIASAVAYARARGVTVVAAAGNDARPTLVSVPAALAGVIGVTAIDAAGRRAPFSNGGVGAAVAAPGVDVVGAFPAARYARWSGTSFAAAFASGGAALLLGRFPDLPPADVAARFGKRARPFSKLVRVADRRALGAGVLDLSKLVR